MAQFGDGAPSYADSPPAERRATCNPHGGPRRRAAVEALSETGRAKLLPALRRQVFWVRSRQERGVRAPRRRSEQKYLEESSLGGSAERGRTRRRAGSDAHGEAVRCIVSKKRGVWWRLPAGLNRAHGRRHRTRSLAVETRLGVMVRSRGVARGAVKLRTHGTVIMKRGCVVRIGSRERVMPAEDQQKQRSEHEERSDGATPVFTHIAQLRRCSIIRRVSGSCFPIGARRAVAGGNRCCPV